MRKEKFTCSLNGTHVGQFPTEEEAEEEFEDPLEEEDELTADWTDALPVTEAEAAWAEEEGPVVVGGSLIWKKDLNYYLLYLGNICVSQLNLNICTSSACCIKANCSAAFSTAEVTTASIWGCCCCCCCCCCLDLSCSVPPFRFDSATDMASPCRQLTGIFVKNTLDFPTF